MTLSAFSLSAMKPIGSSPENQVIQRNMLCESPSKRDNETPTVVQQISIKSNEAIPLGLDDFLGIVEDSECSTIPEQPQSEEFNNEGFHIYQCQIRVEPHAELFWLMTTERVARILSLDGGGIRGVFSAVILQYIEEHTGVQIADLFHLMAGTSTGGLLAASLSVRDVTGSNKPSLMASEIVNLYTLRGSSLFKKICWVENIFRGFRSSYETAPLETIFREICGDTKLSDIPTDLMITYHDMTHGKPAFFKSHFAREAGLRSIDSESTDGFLYTTSIQQDKNDYYLRDVVRATSAAPTFFDPLHLESVFMI
jgi:hypothetical protein